MNEVIEHKTYFIIPNMDSSQALLVTVLKFKTCLPAHHFSNLKLAGLLASETSDRLVLNSH